MKAIMWNFHIKSGFLTTPIFKEFNPALLLTLGTAPSSLQNAILRVDQRSISGSVLQGQLLVLIGPCWLKTKKKDDNKPLDCQRGGGEEFPVTSKEQSYLI